MASLSPNELTYCGLVMLCGDIWVQFGSDTLWLSSGTKPSISEPMLTEKISTNCVMLMWRKDIKCKYMFWFHLRNWARKGLISHTATLILRFHDENRSVILECLPKLSNAIGIHMFTQNTWTWDIMKLDIPEKLPVLTAIRVLESQYLLGS